MPRGIHRGYRPGQSRWVVNMNDFLANAEPITECGCFIWLHSVTSTGYGSLSIDKKYKRAHRVMWELLFGPIPRGMNVLHRCDTRLCINPHHLFLGTQSANILDCISKGRHSLWGRDA
jgi:hypothetical protein